jgi:predicted small lipoprotein YifL
MSPIRVIPALVMVLVLLAGCGKRGPLYLPGEKNPEEQTAPQQDSQQQDRSPGTSGY